MARGRTYYRSAKSGNEGVEWECDHAHTSLASAGRCADENDADSVTILRGVAPVWWAHVRYVPKRRSGPFAPNPGTRQLRRLARRLYDSGVPLDAVAEHISSVRRWRVGDAVVRRWILEEGGRIRAKPPPPPFGNHLPEATKALAVEEYKGGLTLTQIGEEHEVSPSTVAHWLEAAGVPRRKPVPPRRSPPTSSP
jgi:hypothetical protein